MGATPYGFKSLHPHQTPECSSIREFFRFPQKSPAIRRGFLRTVRWTYLLEKSRFLLSNEFPVKAMTANLSNKILRVAGPADWVPPVYIHAYKVSGRMRAIPWHKSMFFIGGCISDDSGGRLCYTGEVILTPFPAFSHILSTPQPMGDTAPMPVITTLLFIFPTSCTFRRRHRWSGR